MTAEEIIREIRNCPEECRRAVDFLLRKYRCACEAYLIDIAITSEWQLYFIEQFQESRPLAPEEIPTWTGKIENEAFGFCCFLDEDTDVSIRILMERMFTIQKIQALLSNADGAATDRAEELNRAGEPAADRQRSRKVKLPPEVFERKIFPILDAEFPFGGKNVGIIDRCAEIGKQYGVSESTIKNKFYDMQHKKRGNKSG